MKIAKVRDVKTPTRGTAKSAGLDFYIPKDFPITTVYPGTAVNIPSGICADIPDGYALIAFNKSGIALKYNLQVGACVIDEDYQGELHLHVFNISPSPVCLMAGMKLTQFVCVPIHYVSVEVVQYDTLYNGRTTERGTGGFGSTDKKVTWSPNIKK